MLKYSLSKNKNLNKTIYTCVGGATVFSAFVHYYMLPKEKIGTLSPEWMSATEEYRKMNKMDEVYDHHDFND